MQSSNELDWACFSGLAGICWDHSCICWLTIGSVLGWALLVNLSCDSSVSTGFSSFSCDQQSNLGMSFSCQWQKCKKESRNTQGPLRLGLQLSHCYFWCILLDKARHIRWSIYLTLVGRTRKFAWQREWIQRGWIVGTINAIHVSHHFALDPTNSD